MNSKRSNRLHLRACLAAAVLAGAVTLQSCKDDVLTGQPSWLGESIYAELQRQGNYTTVLRLIDDLGLTEQMSHTGSLTLFAADDDTFNNWFQTNTWGVRSYAQLSDAQKKMLLYSEEINNAYLVELMSNLSANPPETGRTMRRANSSSVFDSVSVMHWQDMPNTEAWKPYRDNQKDIILFKDGRIMSYGSTSGLSQPMIHFLPAFMENQKFTDEDIRVLSNGIATSTSDAYVAGHLITERDITCKNGYIQKMDGVIEPMPNMAEIISEHPVMSQWSTLINRFSAPYYDHYKTIEYNRIYGTNVDSVFTLRYFADKRQDDMSTQRLPATIANPEGAPASATLTFDPAWNQYKIDSESSDMHEDAAAMLVPTNEALNTWWNTDGRALQEMYHTWDSVPDVVLEPLLSVNMLPSLTSAVPSKFSSILDDAQEEMGVTTADIDSCFLGCNGVVYLTNRVFSPKEYSSVMFPALINQNEMGAIYAGFDAYSFGPYLNSMDSYYSLILPTNDALMLYIDPVYYEETQQSALVIKYDASNASTHLSAERYACTVDDDGTVTLGRRQQASVPADILKNRLNDLINQCIIVGNFEDGHVFYKSKNGTPVRVDNPGQSNMTISGGWQIEHNNPAHVQEIFDQSTTGNGKSYVINSNIPQSASKTVFETLQNHEEFSEFLKLMTGSSHLATSEQILASSMTLQNNPYYCLNYRSNRNVTLFGNYNYTVYAPTNESIKALEDNGTLPTWDDYDKAYEAAGEQEDTICKIIKNRILNFVKYHIQDNAVLIGLAPEVDSDGQPLNQNDYESMMLNPSTNRFYPLSVYFDNSRLSVTDNMGNQRNVVKTDGLYNDICREYWVTNDAGYTKSLYAFADAVVHQIDGPLFYSADQQTPWQTLAKKFQHRKR